MVQERTTIQRESPPLEITSGTKSHLKEIARWALILSIIGFLVISVVLLSATYSSINMGMLRGGQGSSPLYTGLGYLIAGGFMLVPVVAVYQFANFLKLALTNDDQAAMDRAFLSLKGGLKYSGIAIIGLLVLAMLGTYVLPLF